MMYVAIALFAVIVILIAREVYLRSTSKEIGTSTAVVKKISTSCA